MKCIIPCGGSSTRLGTGQNKCLIRVGNKTVLEHIVDFWRGRVDGFIFIAGGDSYNDVVRVARKLGEVIDRKDTVNLAAAICLAESYVGQRFVLALGDCLNIGKFVSSIDDVNFGIGVCIVSGYELRKNYLVEVSGGRVTRAIEKPTNSFGLCGMGTYVMDKRVFNYIRRLNLSPKATSVDLTGALQLAINSEEGVAPMYFEGTYINITHPWDVDRAKEAIWRYQQTTLRQRKP